MKTFLAACAAVLLLQSCASEWRGGAPVQPVTYDLPAHRSERSVGNLRRLAIVPILVTPIGTWGTPRTGTSEEVAAFASGFAAGAAAYLSTEKGYDVVVVEGEGRIWRPEVFKHPEHGSIAELQSAWEVAGTAGNAEDVARRLGRALGVDGLLVMSIELPEKPRDDPATLGLAMLNLVLVNIPLYYFMSHTAAEATILETASGKAVWRMDISGGRYNLQGGWPIAPSDFFEELENAIPARLTR
jgi:hypothetical protein